VIFTTSVRADGIKPRTARIRVRFEHFLAAHPAQSTLRSYAALTPAADRTAPAHGTLDALREMAVQEIGYSNCRRGTVAGIFGGFFLEYWV